MISPPGSSCPSSEHKRSEPERMIMTQTNRHYNKQTKENNLLCTSKTVMVFTDPIPLLSFPTSSNPFPATAAEKQTNKQTTKTPPPREGERLRGREKKRDKQTERQGEKEREGKKRGTCLVWGGLVGKGEVEEWKLIRFSISPDRGGQQKYAGRKSSPY